MAEKNKSILIKVTGVGFVRVPTGTSKEDMQKAANALLEQKQGLQALQEGTELLEGAGGLVQEDTVAKSDDLLKLLRETEANGRYDIMVGGDQFDLPGMTIDEVLDFQANSMDDKESTAVGAYQIIEGTLKYLKKRMKLKGTEKMTPEMQDAMAVELLKRRGLQRWEDGQISDEEFATNISKEWASFPVATEVRGKKPGESYHKGVGSNKALVDVETVLDALDNQRDIPLMERENVPQTAPEEVSEPFEVSTPELQESLEQQNNKELELPPQAKAVEEGDELEIADEKALPPGDYQRDDGSFFTVTTKNEVINYGTS